MARSAAPPACGCATATAAIGRATGRRRNRPTIPIAGGFCEEHAAEYNRNWDYFRGLDAEEAASREADETAHLGRFRRGFHYGWGGPGDGRRSREEMRALDVLELEADAGMVEAKAAWRRLAKANHPDVRPGDQAAAERFPPRAGGVGRAAGPPTNGGNGAA